MKILVTGTPGSGKTTLANYALSLGNYRFKDADEVSDLCVWLRFADGKFVAKVEDIKAEPKNDEWYKNNGWYWDANKIRQLLNADEDLILCGSAENVTDFYDYFDKVFLLVKTSEEIESNINSKYRANPFGKTPAQRAGFMRWQDHLVKEADKLPIKKVIYIKSNDIAEVFNSIENELCY